MQAATWLRLAKGLGVCGALAPEPSTAGDLGSTCLLWDHNAGLLRMGQSPVPRAPGKRAGEMQTVGTPASPSGGAQPGLLGRPLRGRCPWELWPPGARSPLGQGKVVKRKTPLRPQAQTTPTPHQGSGPRRDSCVWRIAQIHGVPASVSMSEGAQPTTSGARVSPPRDQDAPKHPREQSFRKSLKASSILSALVTVVTGGSLSGQQPSVMSPGGAPWGCPQRCPLCRGHWAGPSVSPCAGGPPPSPPSRPGYRAP